MREIERKDERPDSMSAADRDKINQFSRLLTRRAELEAKLKVGAGGNGQWETCNSDTMM